MDKQDYKINIIGAGISGLIAAQILENHGYHPVVLEATDRVGGRVKTDVIDGHQLDHGFQILLEAYPKAKQYLDHEKLHLQKLLPGAVIFKDGKRQTLGDPLRNLSFLFPTMIASIGSFGDKIKVVKLNARLKKKSLPAIFETTEITTLAYLQDFGFTSGMINDFFKPFYSGIFLESDLATSSRMFEFTYKLFGEGLATIPKRGMQAIPDQLENNLKQTDFKFNCHVRQVEDGRITLEDNSTIASHFTLIATEASSLVSNLKGQDVHWKSCDCLYFTTLDRIIDRPIIGLVADQEALVNNLLYMDSIDAEVNGAGHLLSVTVVKKHDLADDALRARVNQELDRYCGIKQAKFLKQYKIKKALPDLNQLHYELAPTETKLTNSIFLAGDQLLNGSLNAAMIAGERAALGIIETLEGGTITGELTPEYL